MVLVARYIIAVAKGKAREKMLSSLLILLSLVGSANAWCFYGIESTYAAKTQTSLHSKSRNESLDKVPSSRARRRVFNGVACTFGLTFLVDSKKADARDELFKPNPLTNPVLEQLRIWEQAEADNIKYDGELEAGDAGNKGKVGAYPRLLAPIVVMDREFEVVRNLVHDENRPTSWQKALNILNDPKYEKVAFKKTFNAYGDNIYYSDPDRANAYLGGGATPKTEQSIAYLLRNDILTNMENLRAELEYLLKNPSESDFEDLYSFADTCTSAMKKYLAIVPPNELEEAKTLIYVSSQ